LQAKDLAGYRQEIQMRSFMRRTAHQWAAVWRRERELSHTYAELMEASDNQLADIGIGRSDVYDVIYRARGEACGRNN
jgi:uncharacterized protein YjiS (DUF1127 family)